MSSYRTVLVGTDGSESSFAAVDRAAALTRDAGAGLLIVCAYHPASQREVAHAQDTLRDEAYLVTGSAPAEAALRTAAERAAKAGADAVQTLAVDGDAVDTLTRVAAEHGAELLVVGNRGLNTLAGRLLGSVPAAVSRRSDCDVLIVHTTP